jgi:3-hydroxyacyl-CoA dehydrogenase
MGKKPIRLHKELRGHVANRLQGALYREIAYLVDQGVLSVADADIAVCWGPGLRWGLMGPSLLWHLADGEGGIRHFMEHLAPGAKGLAVRSRINDCKDAKPTGQGRARWRLEHRLVSRSRQRRLRDVKPISRSPEVRFPDADKVTHVPEFHRYLPGTEPITKISWTNIYHGFIV